MFYDFFQENTETIKNMGLSMLALLSDDSRLVDLADRDLEKVARIFKLFFFTPVIGWGGASDDEIRAHQESLWALLDPANAVPARNIEDITDDAEDKFTDLEGLSVE